MELLVSLRMVASTFPGLLFCDERQKSIKYFLSCAKYSQFASYLAATLSEI